MYLVVQGLICHMHSGAPKTILFAILNSIGGNCSQMMPGVVNTLAAPHGTCNILHGESLHRFAQLLCLSVCLIVGFVCPCSCNSCAYVCICILVCVCVCKCVCVCACACACVQTCVRVCRHVCVCGITHTSATDSNVTCLQR